MWPEHWSRRSQKSEGKADMTEHAMAQSQRQGASTEVPSPSLFIKAALEGEAWPFWASVS